MQLLIATHNKGKVAEINNLLTAAGITCLSLDDAGITFDVEETGTTFLENATLKATQYAQAAGLLTLADDSGLQVDALDGAPGVYTARYGGAALTQPERNQFLLDNVAAADTAVRTARFRCVMVLCDSAGRVIGTADGTCEGEIAHAPRGSGGFGYDPVFWLPARGQTMAELDPAEKHAISHRGNALRAIIQQLKQLQP